MEGVSQDAVLFDDPLEAVLHVALGAVSCQSGLDDFFFWVIGHSCQVVIGEDLVETQPSLLQNLPIAGHHHHTLLEGKLGSLRGLLGTQRCKFTHAVLVKCVIACVVEGFLIQSELVNFGTVVFIFTVKQDDENVILLDHNGHQAMYFNNLISFGIRVIFKDGHSCHL